MSTRRNAIKTAITAIAGASISHRLEAAETQLTGLNGKINHSACRWCYSSIPLDELAQAGVKMGLKSLELLNFDELEVVKKYDLDCAIVMPTTKEWGIPKGWNRTEHHAGLIEFYTDAINKTAAAGKTNLICFSGNRNGLADEQGILNSAAGLKQIMKHAETKKVTMVMELLNSKVNHKDYQCDKTEWGVELAKQIGSDRFKLLYDIYHMQIMEGDVIATIKKNHQYIAHYHTGGVPGRNEIDDSQELYYPAIMKAIVETGYKGFVGQEFMPKRADKLASLEQGVKICDI